MHLSTAERAPMADQSNNYTKGASESLLGLLVGEWAKGYLQGTGCLKSKCRTE